MGTQKISLDAIFSQKSQLIAEAKSKEGTKPITFWVPEGYKVKFDKLQDATDKEFGKMVKALIKTALDKTDVEQT